MTAFQSTIRTIQIITLIILSGLVCGCPRSTDTASDDPLGAADDYWPPWVTKTTTDSASINWRGDSSQSGSVLYATSAYYTEHQSFDKTAAAGTAWYQHLDLTGLEPNTSYSYWVKPSANENEFGVRTFRTMPVGGPFKFIVISDSQEGHNYDETMRFKYVADAIAKEPDALFILDGGDYARFDKESRWATFFQVADPMLAKFAVFPVIGNHEYHNYDSTIVTPSAAVYFHNAYDMPLNYSFDCADVRFVILNSPDPNNANGADPHTSLALTQSQAPWLEEKLNVNMSGIFTMHHHPIWDDNKTVCDPNLQPWETLYHTYGISATFAGHKHNYQSYIVGGIPYFIVGTAGGPFTALAEIHPDGFRDGMAGHLGYLRVTVDPENNTATAEQIAVASVTDSDSATLPVVFDAPKIDDTVTFPLR